MVALMAESMAVTKVREKVAMLAGFVADSKVAQMDVESVDGSVATLVNTSAAYSAVKTVHELVVIPAAASVDLSADLMAALMAVQ